MQFGSGGAGSATHIACALLNSAIGITTTHIPYRGGAPAIQDLIAGRIDYLCIDTPIAIAQIEAHAVKPIAILTRTRSPSLPALATAQEQGLANFEASNWCALFLPKGTPDAIVRRLHDAAVADAGGRRRAGAAAAHRLDRGGARAPVVRLPAEIRRRRDRALGGADPGERRHAELGRVRPAPRWHCLY